MVTINVVKVLIVPEAILDISARFTDMLREAGFDVRYPKDRRLTVGTQSEAETIDELQGFPAVIAGGERYTQTVLQALPDLRVIARWGVGFDRVDIAAATECKIVVATTPTSNHEAVAEHTLALLFGSAKSLIAGDATIRAGQWSRAIRAPIRGKTLGILGLGRIGRSVAVRAAAMRMKVIAAELAPDDVFMRAYDIELVDFATLLKRSDYLSIHCPLNDKTLGLFHRDVFAQMKRGSVLINTARGPLVVEADLAEAVRSGHLGGAGLDVFEDEPPRPNSPLFELDTVLMSPHMAGIDHQSVVDMGTEAAQNILSLYRGEWPEGAVVNDELRSGWTW